MNFQLLNRFLYYIFLWIFIYQEPNLLIAEENSPIQTTSSFVSKDEKWLRPFVESTFMNDELFYTIFGSKPMTSFQITNMSKEECLKDWKLVMDTLDDENKQLLIKKIEKDCNEDASVANYHRWIALKKKYAFSPFLFRAEYSDDSQKYLQISVINLREVAWILQKHYELFLREVGNAFDALKMAQDFENMDSLFWKKVLANHYLNGILYGFGERNAYFFSKMHECSLPLGDNIQTQMNKNRIGKKLTIENFDIPAFRSFGIPLRKDPIILQFEEERSLIQKELQGKDLVEEVFSRLLGKEQNQSKQGEL